MTKYLAFLRGVNVGGQNLIKMKDLCQILDSIGFLNVQTYIQSGNVSFDSMPGEIDWLQRTIEFQIEKHLRLKTKVIIRTLSFIQDIVRNNPFKNIESNQQTKLYVCFLYDKPKTHPSLPLENRKEGLELFRLDEKEAYLVSKEINGRYGFPNNFVEKELNVISTARNWKTINRIVDFIPNKLKL
jgi:uncharacterized protein (DUF1697 family)